MNLAIIPARVGSKRILRKNIKDFCGKPMIAYSIIAAKNSGLFDHILVSTDNEEIANIAKFWGAEVPFIRPKELADDITATVPVIAHAIKLCREFGWKIHNVCCIYPVAPFIEINDLKSAFELLSKNQIDYCFPVTEYPSAIQRSLKILGNGMVQPLYPEFEVIRTQDLESTYYDAGQFYWGKADAWIKNSKIHSNGLAYKIPNWRVVDIDTPDDWKRAEILAHSILNLKFSSE
ncbi:pseudaminic acid cytidylyltransferase [Candidatus Methylopumilus planktonicus]|uniref:pseudaminic acid cytidylyltransferase n=1 Tax=Candidatus Methylopumilus planktonicus TaxID=1581557 RepID=UPI003D187807